MIDETEMLAEPSTSDATEMVVSPAEQPVIEEPAEAPQAEAAPMTIDDTPMPPIEIDETGHHLPSTDPHWNPIKAWVRHFVRREIWMAERGFTLAARERNNP